MAHLLIIELPGGNDIDIVQAAIDRGDEFTFLSAQLDHYHSQPLVSAILAAAFEQIEVLSFDYAELEERVQNVHSRHPFDAVLCLIDTRLTEAARLSEKLGLRYLNVASALMMRDKFSVRCRLNERGIVQPSFELATSNEALKAAVDLLGLPVLIKPADGYGSQNIVVLRYLEDLDPLLSPLDDLLPCRADYGLGVISNDRMLVERYMTGTVIGCDTLTINGQHQLLGIHEKLFFEPPSFAIRGGCFTPNCPEFEAIERYIFSLLDAVGFDWGATHTELMLTAEGPRLIEINPRLVGAKIPRLVGLALDRSIHEDLIVLHLGEGLPSISKDSSMVAVSRWIVADQVGVLEYVELPEWQDGRIRSVEILKKPGDNVRPPLENADRIGYVMVCAPTRSEAEQLADNFVLQTSVKLK
jgi:biotin carboxylase